MKWSDPRPDLRQAYTWWQDDANFRPILPLPLAEKLRPYLYGACVLLCVLGLSTVLHITVGPLRSWLGFAVFCGWLWLLYRLVLWVERRPAAATAETVRALAERRAATAETVRLVEDERWS